MVGGNYVPALDPRRYFVSVHPRRNRRWRVIDNLLGDTNFCPIVRRTPRLSQRAGDALRSELQGLVRDLPAELFQRASDYLYLKETRSTFGIEREPVPRLDRTQRFVTLRCAAGEGELSARLTESALVALQNVIVDSRYAVNAYRTTQNYVGEQRPDYSQRIHYICPPPKFVSTLMAGLRESAQRCEGLPAIVRAATVAFAFVCIHPFEDGNGRLHRFLIHDILHRDGFVAPGVMLPVSATMLRRLQDYDAALDRYAAPLRHAWCKYTLSADGRLSVSNPDEIEGWYRFPDVTAQAEYLAATLVLSIREDFAEELRFLAGYDAALKAIRDIVDVPDRRLDLLLRLIHQNGGKLSKQKRAQFDELTDAELAGIQDAYAEAFARPLPSRRRFDPSS